MDMSMSYSPHAMAQFHPQHSSPQSIPMMSNPSFPTFPSSNNFLSPLLQATTTTSPLNLDLSSELPDLFASPLNSSLLAPDHGMDLGLGLDFGHNPLESFLSSPLFSSTPFANTCDPMVEETNFLKNENNPQTYESNPAVLVPATEIRSSISAPMECALPVKSSSSSSPSMVSHPFQPLPAFSSPGFVANRRNPSTLAKCPPYHRATFQPSGLTPNTSHRPVHVCATAPALSRHHSRLAKQVHMDAPTATTSTDLSMYEDSDDYDYAAYDEMESNDEVYQHLQVRRHRPGYPLSPLSSDDSSTATANSTVLSYISTASTTSPSSNSSVNSVPISAICIKRRPGRPNKIGGRSRPRTRTQYEPLDAEGVEQRNVVRAALIRYNTTQTDLARYIGVCKASMCTWLQGLTSPAMHNRIWSGVNQWMRDQEEIATSRPPCTSCGMHVNHLSTNSSPHVAGTSLPTVFSNTSVPSSHCTSTCPSHQPVHPITDHVSNFNPHICCTNQHHTAGHIFQPASNSSLSSEHLAFSTPNSIVNHSSQPPSNHFKSEAMNV